MQIDTSLKLIETVNNFEKVLGDKVATAFCVGSINAVFGLFCGSMVSTPM